MADELMAGPDLDARVHAEIFIRSARTPCRLCPKDFYLNPDNRCRHIPPYSTDIAAAWLVVEHMQQQGWWWVLSTPFSCKPYMPEWAYVYEASVVRQGTTMSFSPCYRSAANTAALAICLAALAALEARP